MAMSLAFHIIFAAIGMAMPVLMVALIQSRGHIPKGRGCWEMLVEHP